MNLDPVNMVEEMEAIEPPELVKLFNCCCFDILIRTFTFLLGQKTRELFIPRSMAENPEIERNPNLHPNGVYWQPHGAENITIKKTRIDEGNPTNGFRWSYVFPNNLEPGRVPNERTAVDFFKLFFPYNILKPLIELNELDELD